MSSSFYRYRNSIKSPEKPIKVSFKQPKHKRRKSFESSKQLLRVLQPLKDEANHNHKKRLSISVTKLNILHMSDNVLLIEDVIFKMNGVISRIKDNDSLLNNNCPGHLLNSIDFQQKSIIQGICFEIDKIMTKVNELRDTIVNENSYDNRLELKKSNSSVYYDNKKQVSKLECLFESCKDQFNSIIINIKEISNAKSDNVYSEDNKVIPEVIDTVDNNSKRSNISLILISEHSSNISDDIIDNEDPAIENISIHRLTHSNDVKLLSNVELNSSLNSSMIRKCQSHYEINSRDSFEEYSPIKDNNKISKSLNYIRNSISSAADVKSNRILFTEQQEFQFSRVGSKAVLSFAD